MEDVQSVTLPQQKTLPSWSLPFPLILTPRDDLQSRSLSEWLYWLHPNSPALRQELLRHGAIYFRGFPLQSPADFDAFVKQFGFENFPYVGGAATRRVIVGDVFTSNEAPSESTIPYHHEMAQVPDNPDVLFFYCDVTPGEGGETPLVLSHLARDQIAQRDPGFVARLERDGVRYVRVAPDGDDPTSAIGRGWQSTFGGASDHVTAERRAAEQGTSIQWLEDGSARTVTKVLPATRQYDRTGRSTWFNSIIAAYVGWNDSRNTGKRAVLFGGGLVDQNKQQVMACRELEKHDDGLTSDTCAGKADEASKATDLGEPMPEHSMKIVLDAMEELAVSIPWQKGDVMMIDNKQVLHARRPFTPPRTILACLCRDKNTL